MVNHILKHFLQSLEFTWKSLYRLTVSLDRCQQADVWRTQQSAPQLHFQSTNKSTPPNHPFIISVVSHSMVFARVPSPHRQWLINSPLYWYVPIGRVIVVIGLRLRSCLVYLATPSGQYQSSVGWSICKRLCRLRCWCCCISDLNCLAKAGANVSSELHVWWLVALPAFRNASLSSNRAENDQPHSLMNNVPVMESIFSFFLGRSKRLIYAVGMSAGVMGTCLIACGLFSVNIS